MMSRQSPRRSALSAWMAAAAAAALAIGCGGGKALPPPEAASVALPAAPPPALSTWQTITSPMEGISIAMPSEVREGTSTYAVETGEAQAYRAWSSPTDGDGAVYSVERHRFPEGEDFTTLDIAKALLERVDVSRSASIAGHPGTAFEGVTDKGVRVLGRSFFSGACIYIIRVDIPASAPVPRQETERFFGSFRFASPWRLFTSEEGRFTASVPVIAKESVIPIAKIKSQMQFFFMGGETQSSYATSFTDLEVDAIEPESEGDILDASILGDDEDDDEAIIEPLRPIELFGAKGREAIKQNENGMYTRVRVYLLGKRLYIIQALGKTTASVKSPDADRFLDSFRMVPGP